jgi:ubiquitin-like 1-activating enzyme E1 B
LLQKIQQNNLHEALIPDQMVWSVSENVRVFLRSVESLHKRMKEKGPIEFDKDDDDALDFVTSASNIRSHIFNIPIQSRFNAKGELFLLT